MLVAPKSPRSLHMVRKKCWLMYMCIVYIVQAKKKKKKSCRDPGSNQGPLDLQSNALPTELSRPHVRYASKSSSHSMHTYAALHTLL